MVLLERILFGQHHALLLLLLLLVLLLDLGKSEVGKDRRVLVPVPLTLLLFILEVGSLNTRIMCLVHQNVRSVQKVGPVHIVHLSVTKSQLSISLVVLT